MGSEAGLVDVRSHCGSIKGSSRKIKKVRASLQALRIYHSRGSQVVIGPPHEPGNAEPVQLLCSFSVTFSFTRPHLSLPANPAASAIAADRKSTRLNSSHLGIS